MDEFMNRRWEQSTGASLAPNITKLTDQSNFISQWVATIILQQTSTRRRVRAVEKVIQLAKEFRKLNNFHFVAAIIGALNSSPILRLKSTRDKVSSSSMKVRRFSGIFHFASNVMGKVPDLLVYFVHM
jgi:hypothetical protein